MITCTKVDKSHKQLYFEAFSSVPLDYLEDAPKTASDFVRFEVTDKQTEKVSLVFVRGTELQRIGISLTTWKQLQSRPEKLPGLIRNAAKIEWMLKRAASVASKHLACQFLTFFTDEVAFANRIISGSIFKGIRHLSGIKGVPGMYFQPRESSTDIFINLKKTLPLGAGGYGKVRKVLWLSAPEQTSVLVAKKVLNDKRVQANTSHFEREIRTLQELSNKRGIISLIAGGIYDNKFAIFLPAYEYDLFRYLKSHPFPLKMDEVLSMISQWLEGLAAISEKGIHGDLSSNNLLLKRGGKEKIEAVITDFGSFRSYGEEKHGLTTITFGSPEYFAKYMVTSKQDVWAMGISLYEIFSKSWLPCWKFHKEHEMLLWTSTLTPDWILKYPLHPKTPPFLLDLINVMLDPRYDHRPSAKEAFERFSKSGALF